MSERGDAAAEPPIEELEEALGHRFRDRRLLEKALQHASFAHETAGAESNERLEFLGDAVLGLVVADLLYNAHPGWREGDLTRALHQLVDRRALARLGRELALGRFLRLGRTERRSAGEGKDTILADAVEAVIGALFLDAGLAPVEALGRRAFAAALAPDAPRVRADPKTRLQEAVMERHGEFPSYELVGDREIEGHEERFTVRVLVGGEEWGEGTGRSKRIAERAAAQAALERLEPAASGAGGAA